MRTSILGFAAILAGTVLLVLLPTSHGSSAPQLTATPATLNSVFARASGGDTIELASGDYGSFGGSLKSGMVTLAAQPGAAVTIELDFDPASNITVDGVTITEADVAGSATHNIVIRNSDIPGPVTLRTTELANANILLEHNVHRDFDKCGSCGEGRVFLPGDLDQPSGITIRDSEFRGGLSDGIQNGSNGTQILNNSFHDIEPGSPEGVHSDAIQLYGSRNTVIRGNYFYNLREVPAIMAADGTDHELIEDNVIAGTTSGYPYVTLFSDDGSIVRHNTFDDGDCVFNLPCGVLRIGAKSGDPAGRGTIVEDNILSDISVEAGSLARRSHNLVIHDQPSGAGDIAGSPAFVGGANPTSYAGYRLASGSPGKGNASDGLDRGARINLSAATPGGAAPPHGDVAGCDSATAKVTRAKKDVKRAKKRLRRADGHKQTKKAKKKLKRAKKKLKRAKRERRETC